MNSPSRHDGHDPPEVIVRFEEHLVLADRLARRYSHRHQVDDDLRQVARTGLLLASRRFDPALGNFVRFATVTIIGELKKHLRSHGWAVHVPRSLQEDSITIAASRDRLTGRLHRPPLISDIAADVGFSSERVVEALRVLEVRFNASVEPAEDRHPLSPDPSDVALLNLAIAELDDGEQKLLELRFGRGLTQDEIGERIGLSQPQVHRRLNTALGRLRRKLTEQSS